MTPALDIRGAGTSFAVLHGGRVIGRATSHGNAVALERGLARRLAEAPATCLCCGAPFKSTGKANRLCQPCREG